MGEVALSSPLFFRIDGFWCIGGWVLSGKGESFSKNKNNKSSIYKYLIIRCFV